MKITLPLLCLLLTACQSLDSRLRSLPPVAFKSWAHSDRYGLFTDSVTVSGASWKLNPDGSATLTIAQYDGQAAWAGAVGPHDTFSDLVVTFPAGTPQAAVLSMAANGVPKVP